MGAHYAKAIELKSARDEKAGVLCAWASALQIEAEALSGNEAEGLLAEACKKCQRATELNPNDWYAFGAWGNALTTRARDSKETEVASHLYAEAMGKFEVALRINPSSPAVMFDFAQLLPGSVARWSAQADTHGIFGRACEMLVSS